MRRLLMVAVVVLAGCTTPMSQDINLPHEFGNISKDYPPELVAVSLADHYDVFYNMDGHPNLVRVCVGGVGILTTTREYGDAINIVDEWSDYCAQFTGESDHD